MKTAKHIFSIFIPESSVHKNLLSFSDPFLCKRLSRVLRLQEGDFCIFFNKKEKYETRIHSLTEKEGSAEILAIHKNMPLQPEISLWLPVLDHSQMEDSFYTAAQIGVKEIHLFRSKKSQSAWGSKKDYERAERIIIAACEQAKCFFIPLLSPSLHTLENASLSNPLLFFEVSGKNFFEAIPFLKKEEKLNVVLGPEGGFTEEEMFLLQSRASYCIRLTPTILRSCDALEVGLGMLRSIL